MSSQKTFIIITSMIFFQILSSQILAQQNLPFIRVSPHAKAIQDISFATVEIDYSRPGVRGREVYGRLVPYGLAPNAFGNRKPMPWRAGANENTTISLSHDVTINGSPLSAGIYSIHMIVQEEEWTIIFNSDYQAWGSFFYEESKDVLRIKVKPEKYHQENGWSMDLKICPQILQIFLCIGEN